MKTYRERKTEDEFETQGKYNGKWEMLCTDVTRKEGQQTLRDYRENEPGTEFRLITRRVRKPEKPEQMVTVLYIDAWRSVDGGWFWNTWHKAGEVPASWLDLFPKSPRALLHRLRKEGFGGEPGKVEIEDDGHNLVIKARSNDMPRYALAYGDLSITQCPCDDRPVGPIVIDGREPEERTAPNA